MLVSERWATVRQRMSCALACVLAASLSACAKRPPSSSSSSTAQAAQPPSAQRATAAPARQATGSPSAPKPLPARSPDAPIAGVIFGVPVPASNYYFAKRVSYMFPHPWEEHLSDADRERAIWEALILHYESFRRGVTVSDKDMEEKINAVLKNEKQPFTRSGDPAAYAAWVKETLREDVELFENQMRYLFQIDQLKDEIRRSLPVTATEEEMQQEFLNEKHHVGGEMVTFETKDEAQAFYERVKEPAAWEAMKASGQPQVKPVSLMTLEAYMDLWGIPKEQMYAFHAMALGSVGPPMPFGKQWCVYRLLDKRTGDLNDFPKERDAYEAQIKAKKRYEGLKKWIEELKGSAKLEIRPLPPS